MPVAGLPPITIPAMTCCLGLEADPWAYVAHLVHVFRLARQALRPDGTLWLNLGDSFAANRAYQVSQSKHKTLDYGVSNATKVPAGLKAKDMVGIPWRVAYALQADGWYLRMDVIWEKPNAMPESVTDRPTKAHEYVFLLGNSKGYYFDATAIAEKWTCEFRGGPTGRGENAYAVASGVDGNPQQDHTGRLGGNGETRNKRSVWEIATQALPEAHYAPMPEALAELCIKAGASPYACPHCGAGFRRLIEKTGHVNKREPAHAPYSSATKTDSTDWAPTKRATEEFVPGCKCANNDGSAIPVVLEPFAGSGTTMRVAERLRRDSIGIELNDNYIEISDRRTAAVQNTLLV